VHEVEPNGLVVDVVPREKEPAGHVTHWGTVLTTVYHDPGGQTVHEDAPTAATPKAVAGVVKPTVAGVDVTHVAHAERPAVAANVLTAQGVHAD